VLKAAVTMTTSTLTRWFAFASILALSTPMPGCAGIAPEEDVGIDEQDTTDVPNSAVKRQAIGNCWLYATASWAESMELAATGSEINLSESYWTYWHWFDQIVGGRTGANGEISTGGSFYTASSIIKKYGVMTERDFIYAEGDAEMSARQASALAAMNAALKSGALKDATARRNRTAVRRELDRAWGLTTGVVSQLDKVFGAGVTANFTQSRTNNSGTKILKASQVAASYTTGPGTSPARTTLLAALSAWREEYYPWTESTRRSFQIRFQKAMHDKQPVIMSWFVDFNALDGDGRFFEPPATPGRQGGHMVVMEDYEISNVPGFGTLKAGVLETRKAALDAALSPSAKLEFIRVKNSWGSYRPDRAFALPGFHDLYMKYLNGPIKQCQEKDGVTDPNNCVMDQAFNDVVLPPGY
jgi:hypothetical protein